MKTHTIISLSLAAALALGGCAKEKATDTSAANKNYFEAWVSVHHPDATRSGDGIYILEDTPGTGAAVDASTEPYVFIEYTITDLDGNVSSTTSEQVAKRIGSYSNNNYYGDWVWQVTDGSFGLYAGLEQMLDGMRVGGTRKAAIPYWLCTTDRYSDEAQYLKKVTSGSNVIYTVTLNDIKADIEQYEVDLMDAYSKAHLGGIDSTYYAGNEEYMKFGFYYLTRNAKDVKMDYEMPSDTTMYLNYTARLLDGKVFDTTEADSAKLHHIFNEARIYQPVKITRASTYTDIALDGSSDLCPGFQAAVYMMHPMEKATTVFWSGLGYSFIGRGNSIPGYAPLRFDLQLVEEP